METTWYERKEHIAVIKLDEAQNEAQELISCLEKISEDRDIYVLILECSGEIFAEGVWADSSVLSLVEGLTNPVLAVVQSDAEDSRAALLEACDICIAGTSAEEAGREAISLAEQICANGPIAVQQIKRCVNFGLAHGVEAGLAYENQAFALCNGTKDKTIGMNAFLNDTEKKFVNQ